MTTWTWICLSPCILALLGLAFFAGYAYMKHVYGPQGASMIWLYQLVLFLLIITAGIATILALQLIRDGIVTGPILIAISAIWLVIAVNAFTVRRCVQSAQQVLYASPTRKHATTPMMVVLGLLSVAIVVMLAFSPTANVAYYLFVVLAMALCWALAFNTYFRSRNPVILTTTAIIAAGSVYHWDKIRAYYIAPSRRYAPLILRVPGWFPLTNTVVVLLGFDEVNEVSALLAERLPRLRDTGQSTSDISDTATKLA